MLMRAMVLVVLSFGIHAGSASAAWSDLSRGFSVVPSGNDSLCTEDFFQSVRNLQSIGANLVSVRIPWWQTSATDNEFTTYHRTPTDESLVCGINYILSLGMGFGVELVIDGPLWRAYFEPTDRNLWFASLGQLAVKYAREIAAPYGANFFSVGTEMYSLVSNKHNPENAAAPGRYRWPQIIDDIRAEYGGVLTYSAQHSGDRSAVFDDNDLIPNLHVLGFSGYWPLYASTKAGLLTEFDRIERDTIVPAINRYGKNIVLGEVGYRPCVFAFERPYDSQTACEYDGAAQALAWDALLTFFADKTYFKGIIGAWAWSDMPYIGGEGNTDYTPWGKPAADSITSHWPLAVVGTLPPWAFGESQFPGVPYCDPADTNVPENGWGNLSNYTLNGVALEDVGCLYKGGPADNDSGVAPGLSESPEEAVPGEATESLDSSTSTGALDGWLLLLLSIMALWRWGRTTRSRRTNCSLYDELNFFMGRRNR